MTGNGVARMLGLSSDEARLLLGRARARFGAAGLAGRQLAFWVATAPLLRRLLPRRLREAAIRPFVYALVPGPTENLLYARVPRPRSAEAKPRQAG
jgi:hypothetical protein